MDICNGNLTFDSLISKYSTSELPSGVKSRLYLFSRIIDNADAAIILSKRPRHYNRMYNALNELILFGGNSCNNAHSLQVKITEDLNIPILKLKYPTTQNEIISLIDKTNNFLKNLKSSNEANLTVDLHPKKNKVPVFDVKKKLLDKLI